MGLKDNLNELDALRQMLEASQEQAAFGREVRRARKSRGLTLDDLAAATGIAKSYLSQIETGYAAPPRDDKVRRIAAALGLDAESLLALAHVGQMPEDLKARMRRLREVFDSTEEVIRGLLGAEGEAGGKTDDKAKGEATEAGAPAVDLDSLHRSGLLNHLAEWGEPHGAALRRAKVRQIPVINKVAAGYPAEFTDLGYPVGVADEYVACPADLDDPNAFAVRVVGDSMEPKYREGDVVILSPAAAVKSGDDCFVRFSGGAAGDGAQATFKRVFFDAEDQVRLQPLNERHPPVVVKPSDIGDVFRAVARYERL
jgi:phage repressor protein C with HTH and peptisase S24 domain/DNA-binding XRE family transcriptional regulator